MDQQTQVQINESKHRVWNTLRHESFLLINKTIMRIYGIHEAILLSDLISKDQYFSSKGSISEDGWFFNTQIDREEDTTLSPYQQASVIKNLTEKQVLFVERKGLPARQYFKINYLEIDKQLTSNLSVIKNPETSYQETKEQDLKKLNNNSSRNLRTIYNKNKDNKNKDKSTLSKDKDSFIGDSQENPSNGSFNSFPTLLPHNTSSPQSETEPINAAPPSPLQRSRSKTTPQEDHRATPLIDYWNTLPNVIHHLQLGTKTRAQAARFIVELLTGTFYRKNILDKEWYRKWGIDPSQAIGKRFTEKQIMHGLKLISNANTRGYGWQVGGQNGRLSSFYPANDDQRKNIPNTLPAALYNPVSRKSWFLRCLYCPPKHMDRLTPPDPDPQATQLFLSSIPHHDSLTPQQKTSLIYSIDSIRRFHAQINWQEANRVSCLWMYLGRKDQPEAFYKCYIKWLLEEQQEHHLRVSLNALGPGSYNWKQFCQYFYNEKGFKLLEGLKYGE